MKNNQLRALLIAILLSGDKEVSNSVPARQDEIIEYTALMADRILEECNCRYTEDMDA